MFSKIIEKRGNHNHDCHHKTEPNEKTLVFFLFFSLIEKVLALSGDRNGPKHGQY